MYLEKSEQLRNKCLIKLGNIYDYSKVRYINYKNKLEIICPEHGSFFKRRDQLSGCPKCSNRGLTNYDIIKKFKKIHLDKYDYSKVEYKNYNTKVEIICPEHGSFWQEPVEHLREHGCKQCFIKRKTGSVCKRFSQVVTIDKFKKIHQNKYIYDKSIYTGNLDKIEIICPDHGSFFQTPMIHKRGSGCPKCSLSKGETMIQQYLEESNINYILEAKLFENYRFDFFIEEYNLAIEFDGEQHFKPIDFAGKGNEWANTQLIETKRRDSVKNQFCKDNNINLLRISYWNIDLIQEIIQEELEYIRNEKWKIKK